MSWPIYYKNLIRLGNPKSQVGIVTLWTICDEVIKDIDKETYCAAGQLYTKNGLNYLVRNLLANKNIRYLLVCGQDRGGSGQELLTLWKTSKSDFLHKEIAADSIKKLTEKVKLINLNADPDAGKNIAEVIGGLDQSLPSYGKKEEFPEPKTEELNELECRFPTDAAVFKARGKTVAETWLKVLKTILKFGDVKETDSMKIKEVLNMAAVITDEDPENLSVPEWLGFDHRKIEDYLPQIISKEKIAGLHYTYGYRLGGHFEIDQIEKMIEKLKRDPNAREALGVLFDPRVDIEAEHRPCIVLVQALRNQNKLNFNAYVRSHDMFGGWPLNAFGLRKLQKRLCDETNTPIGSLTLISASAHIYDFNWEEVQKIVRKNLQWEFEADPRGFFKIDINKETKEILAEHFSPEGNSLKVFQQNIDTPKAALELAKKINEELCISLTSHALDLGIELQKAESALRLDKDYVQDQPFLLD